MLSPAPLRNACQLARHKDGRTTQRYLHARDSHLLAAAVG